MRTFDTKPIDYGKQIILYILFTSIMEKILFKLVFINASHDITITYFVLATIGLDFILNTISLDNYYVFHSI